MHCPTPFCPLVFNIFPFIPTNMAQFNVKSVKALMEKIANGVDVSFRDPFFLNVISFQLASTTKALAVMDIPLTVAADLEIEKTLTAFSGSPLLSGAIHEILKKLEGKKEKEGQEAAKKTKPLRRTSSKKTVKSRRSSAGVKKNQENEEKENENVVQKRLFKKKESQKKESRIWKKITKSKQ